ncbi:hypothetical protein ACFL6A_04765 [bacterium]
MNLDKGYSQRLFFAVLYSKFKINSLDISPEIDSGTGYVEFKFFKGFNFWKLVEVKLSTNSKIISGYTKKLEEYEKPVETLREVYLVIYVGQMSKRNKRLMEIPTETQNRGELLSVLELIDAG